MSTPTQPTTTTRSGLKVKMHVTPAPGLKVKTGIKDGLNRTRQKDLLL